MKSIRLLLFELFCKWLVLEKRFYSWHFCHLSRYRCTTCPYMCKVLVFPSHSLQVACIHFLMIFGFQVLKRIWYFRFVLGICWCRDVNVETKKVVRVIHWHLVYSIIEFYKRGRETKCHKCHNVVTLWDWLRKYNSSNVMSKPYDTQSVSHFSWRFSGMGRQVL